MIYLYIKTHNETGLRYFGKTKKDPHKYRGSGKYWLAHLKVHGENVSTQIYGVFATATDAKSAALEFSRTNDIVASTDWANLREENGTDGAPIGHPGHVFTDEEKLKLSVASTAMWANPDIRRRISKSHAALWETEERKQKHELWLKEHWTSTMREHQSKILRGRANPKAGRPGQKKPPGHGANVSAATLGISKTRCCRIFDHREMSVNAFSKWLNQLTKSGCLSP